MEDRKANIISLISVIALIIFIIVARVSLKLSHAFFLVCGASIAVIIAVFSCSLIRHRYNCRRRLLESQLKTEGRELRIEYSFLRKVAGVPTKFRYKELEEATDGFQSLLGRGSSAVVFKGILSDGTSVAVKRIDGEERGEKEVEDPKDRTKKKWEFFPKVVNEKVREGKFMEIVDRRLIESGGIEESEVIRLVYIALWCIQEKPRLRPSMAQVVDMLEKRVRVDEPPGSRMILVDILAVDEDPVDHRNLARLLTSVSSNVDCTSTYSLGTTILSGR
ncbi:hypothetical protein ACSQ67_006897 [Phaseolus vulgaris]